jgi:hypothetical protein
VQCHTKPGLGTSCISRAMSGAPSFSLACPAMPRSCSKRIAGEALRVLKPCYSTALIEASDEMMRLHPSLRGALKPSSSRQLNELRTALRIMREAYLEERGALVHLSLLGCLQRRPPHLLIRDGGVRPGRQQHRHHAGSAPR